MKWNSLVRRIITCAVAAATIATAAPAYAYATEAEDEVIVVEDENDVVTQDIEESTDVDDDILGEDDCEFCFSWDKGLIITVIEPADIAGEVKAGEAIKVKKGTTVKFTIDRKSRRYAILSVKNGGENVSQNADGSCSVVIGDESEIRIETEERNKVTFEAPDNAGKIAVTPLPSEDFEPMNPFSGYIYLRPNATIRWVYKPDEGYSVTKVAKVDGSREIELKPVDKPVKEGEVGIYELKNVTKDVIIRRYSKKDLDHKLTLSGSSDYDSVHVVAYDENNKVVNSADVEKGKTFEFNEGNRLAITGLGTRTDKGKNIFTYFVRVTDGEKQVYGSAYKDENGEIFNLGNRTDNFEIAVEGRPVKTADITAKGKLEGPYSVTTTVASKKGDYINLTKRDASTKVTFAVKKTGSIAYEIASDEAAIQFGAGNAEPISLTKEKNSYCYEIPFDDLARLAYSEKPSIEFTTSVAAKLPAPAAKVSASTDIDVTLSLDVPKAAKDLSNLWYKVEAKANVSKGKTLPEGMANEVGPLYVQASTTSLPVYLMAEEGKNPGDGAAQKYDFTVTLLQLENEPEYSGEPITDKSAVEGADGGNVVGVSTAKKVSGSTKKPGYEEKLGLNKKQISFIRGEGGDDGILLATAKYSKNTTFRSLSYAKITNASGEIVKSSDNEADSKRIILDGDSIILEDTDDLTPGKYTLSVLPVSRIGSPLPKAATLALTVKQGIDELTVSVPQSSYVKKPKKALTIKPTVTYNGGDRKKAPAAKKVKWELLDADGNALTDASPLFGKVTINQKNGAVTVAKDLVISGDPSAYRFVIMATAADYAGNMAAAKTGVIELTSEETKPDTKGVEVILNDISGAPEGLDKSDIEVSGVQKSGGKMYATGEEIRVRITKAGISDNWGASITAKPGNDTIQAQRDGEYACFSSDAIREKMKKAKNFQLLIYF